MNLAVFDTNVIVSGFLKPHGPPGRIVECLRQGSIRAALDDRIAGEYAEVLHRPAFDFPPGDVRIVLEAIRYHALSVDVPASARAAGLPDLDDAPFLECAHAAGVPLVTGNTRHFPAKHRTGVRVMTPAEFMDLAASDPPAAE